jgi:hypothetical protein
MNSTAPQIGFDRFVQLDWAFMALQVGAGAAALDELNDLVGARFAGVDSRRKTVDILKRLWINPFPQSEKFVQRGLVLHRELGEVAALPLIWGASISAYPFFGKVSELMGRLFALQGDCSIPEVQRRSAEIYGDRDGITRAVSRIIQTQTNWNVIRRVEGSKRLIKSPPAVVSNDELTAWLIEAAVRYIGKPVSVPTLQSLVVLFPFSLIQPLAYVVSNSAHLELRSEGPSNQFVALRATI